MDGLRISRWTDRDRHKKLLAMRAHIKREAGIAPINPGV